MNQLWNLNATNVKEVKFDPVQVNSTINITVENCDVNCYIDKIVFYLNSADNTFGSQTQVSLTDRGHNYSGSINGYYPITFTTIGVGQTITGGTNTSQIIEQTGNTVVVQVGQSVQDSEGLGNIYVKLTRTTGTFSVGFTMAVFYRPEITFNSYFNTRNQTSNDKPFRVLSQVGLGTFGATTSTMTDVTKTIANYYHYRDNIRTASNSFAVTAQSPYFYFGTPYPTKRWWLGVASDCYPNIGIVSFSYYNGTSFVGFSTTQVALGALGPGTYQLAYDGVVIFTPPSDWKPLTMANDPYTRYNSVIIGLGTLATNNMVNNPGMYWIQCQVGFASTVGNVNTTVNIASVVPLIDPALPLTYRRRLI